VRGDSTLAFLRDGYLYGTRRFERHGDDAVRTRLLGRPVTLLRGVDGVRFFYEGGRFDRAGAMPMSVLAVLQDLGSVQTLEGEAHLRRKDLFLDLATGPSGAGLVVAFERELLAEAESGRSGGDVRALDLFNRVLTRAVCAWAGLPAAVRQEFERSGVLAEMVEAAGSFGVYNRVVRLRRRRAERMLADAVLAERAAPSAPPGSPLAVVAGYGEPDPLPPEVAAVELLNLLRPTVAVSRFLTFAVHALHRHPGWRADIGGGDDPAVRWFANEVRRFYPFFPVVGGRATRAMEGLGLGWREGDWALLDLYATDHDARLWTTPRRFLPQRFEGLTVEPNTLVPQGGGRYREDHRCPGEPVTVDLLDAGIRLLTRRLRYRVPEQDLRISLRRFPALPEDGMVVSGLAVA
jgi:fatty-acid peroxygenase